MMQGDTGESYAMDFEFVPASPDSRWMGEAAARQRQRRLSSQSLRAFLSPAFDAVAWSEGAAPGYSSSSSSSSGGLDLGFDASLLRYRRARFDAAADLDSRILRFSPQSAPPPPQARLAYPVSEDGIWAPGAYHYGNKHEAGDRLAATPVFHDFEGISFTSPRRSSANHPDPARGTTKPIKLPADHQEGAVQGMKVDVWTPKAEGKALSEESGLNEEEEDHLITQALYGHSGKRRLPVFMEICPE